MISVGIDIGNSKISCIVGDLKNNKKDKILSFISKPTKNVTKGIITDLKKVKLEVEEVLNLASKESQTNIANVRLSLPLVDSLSNYLTNEIYVSNEKISKLHIKKTINNSDLLKPIENFKVIYNSIKNYELDQHSGIKDPIGMYCNKLKVNFYKLAIKQNYIKSIVGIFDEL
tara:strand:- start:46 stop:561 length:516 start_codon:yes stop_codon:yes gene_type:complete